MNKLTLIKLQCPKRENVCREFELNGDITNFIVIKTVIYFFISINKPNDSDIHVYLC